MRFHSWSLDKREKDCHRQVFLIISWKNSENTGTKKLLWCELIVLGVESGLFHYGPLWGSYSWIGYDASHKQGTKPRRYFKEARGLDVVVTITVLISFQKEFAKKKCSALSTCRLALSPSSCSTFRRWNKRSVARGTQANLTVASRDISSSVAGALAEK